MTPDDDDGNGIAISHGASRGVLPTAVVGLRVRVCPIDDPGDLRGEIIALEDIDFGGTTIPDFPTIRLDDGRVLTGVECWWTADADGEPNGDAPIARDGMEA